VTVNNAKEFWQRYRRSKSATAGLIIVLFYALIAIIGPIFAPYGPYETGSKAFQPPNAEHLMGTDDLGRDVFSQVLYGARTSLMIGLIVAGTSTLIGVMVGAISGYIGGRVDDILMRVVELFMMIPSFFLLMILMALFGSSILNIILVMGILGWPGTARLIRAEFLALKEQPFVESARSLGASRLHIIFSEILPNATPPIIVNSTLAVGSAIISESGLSFLGLGDPEVMSWGKILGNAQRFITHAWHLPFFPGLSIFLTSLGLNMMGDGLNDTLNPKLKER